MTRSFSFLRSSTLVAVGALMISPVSAQESANTNMAAASTTSATAASNAKLSQEDIKLMLDQAESSANKTASLEGIRSTGGKKRPGKFHIFIVDRNGKTLGGRSMPDAWTGSLDIALSKARTAAFFSSNENAFTSRHIGMLSQSHGADGTGPAGGLWGIGHSNQATSDAGFTGQVKRNGIITFPGGLPLYKDGILVGGIGVSGDSVDQDEAVAYAGAKGFMPGSDVGTIAPLEPKAVEMIPGEN